MGRPCVRPFFFRATPRLNPHFHLPPTPHSDSTYTPADLVGGPSGIFSAGGATFRRTDTVAPAIDGGQLHISLYERVSPPPPPSRPTVLYAHCNSGSRRDADEVLGLLLPRGASVLAVDFRGSGLSSGDVVSLGATEAADIDAALAWLTTARPSTTRIALWGRSMGAVAALLAAATGGQRHRVSAVVCDSPFATLPSLLRDLATSRALPLPRLLVPPALALMRRSVRRKAGFDVKDVSPLHVVASATAPALFGHADADSFIPVAHTHRLHAAYGGEKAVVTFGGDHNSARPPLFRAAAAAFLEAALGIDPPPAPCAPSVLTPDAALLAAVAAFDTAVVAGGAPAPGAAAAAHAAAESAWRVDVPADVAALADDVAERLMVEEAVRQSLVVAETPHASRRPSLGGASTGRASGSGGPARGAGAGGMTPDQRALAAFFAGESDGGGGSPSPWRPPSAALRPPPPPPPRRLLQRKKGQDGVTSVRASSVTEAE